MARKYLRIRRAEIIVTSEKVFVLITLVHPKTQQTIIQRFDVEIMKDGQKVINGYKRLYKPEK